MKPGNKNSYNSLKSLNINKMILVTRSKKKVIGLEGYNIKITKQELI